MDRIADLYDDIRTLSNQIKDIYIAFDFLQIFFKANNAGELIAEAKEEPHDAFEAFVLDIASKLLDANDLVNAIREIVREDKKKLKHELSVK